MSELARALVLLGALQGMALAPVLWLRAADSEIGRWLAGTGAR